MTNADKTRKILTLTIEAEAIATKIRDPKNPAETTKALIEKFNKINNERLALMA